MWIEVHNNGARLSRYTYRCVVLPDITASEVEFRAVESQCTYRCVVLPDPVFLGAVVGLMASLNAPTGAWCSLTLSSWGPSLVSWPVSMHLQVRGAP